MAGAREPGQDIGEFKAGAADHHHIHGIRAVPVHKRVGVLRRFLDVHVCAIHSTQDLGDVCDLKKVPHGLSLGAGVRGEGDVIWGMWDKGLQELAENPRGCGLANTCGLGSKPLERA